MSGPVGSPPGRDEGAPEVLSALRERLSGGRAIPFAEFMATALYLPGAGYYTRPDATTGRVGDFSTSSDVSPAFGRRLAVQAADVWRRLGRGAWHIVELGPGRGLLASDLLEGLAELEPEAHGALAEYVMVEVGAGLAARQVQRAAARAGHVRVRPAGSLAELPARGVRGLVLGNEFLDALPVHLVARRGTALRERCVTLDPAGGGFAWTDGPLVDPRLAARIDRYGLCRRDGDQAEVCLALEETVAQIDRVLEAGAAIFVDYGHAAAVLADEAHAEGTVVAYHRHRVETDLLARPGAQDITAHVNWDHLEDAAREAGLTPAGRTTQDRFLLALGIVEDMMLPAEADAAAESPAALARRLAARSLVMPGAGGGKRFEAACFVRGIDPGLRGLGDPFRLG